MPAQNGQGGCRAEGERGNRRDTAYIDPQGQREAISRLCIARWGRAQVLITSEFWAEEAARWSKVWELVLDTLQLDTPIQDPTRGPAPPA